MPKSYLEYRSSSREPLILSLEKVEYEKTGFLLSLSLSFLWDQWPHTTGNDPDH